MRTVTELAVAVTSGWVRFYTRGLPVELRDLRRAEIHSDLWEHQHEGRAEGAGAHAVALEILQRVALGAFDDLGWRRETIRAWRTSMPHSRRTTMTISASRMRWTGFAAVVGGVVWTAGSFIPNAGRAFEASYVIGSMLLCVLGVFGFYLQQRPSVGRVGTIGLVSLLVGFVASLIAVSVAELVSEDHVVAGVLGILAWPLLIPLGFLLVGLGTPIRFRYVVLAVGALLILGLTPVGAALKSVFAPAALLFSNLGSGALWAIGLLVIGTALVSGARVQPAARAKP